MQALSKKQNSPDRVFAYLVTRQLNEPFYALFPNGDGSSFTRVEYEGTSVHWVHFLETRDAIQFLLAVCDAAYKIIPIFTAHPITERRHKYYEAQGIAVCRTL